MLTQVDPDDVEVGDIIVIKPGERIPLDGVVIEGESLVDTAALTGESVPRSAKAGDEIIKVNGYNEDLLEWGHEDAEFAYRLHFAGVRKKALKMGGIMYHLYHKEASKAQENMHKDVLNQVKKERLVRCTNGIDQYL